MDKLRENAFAIGVSLLGLGAAILYYFLVLGPIFNQLGADSGSIVSDLTAVNNRLNRYKNKAITPVLPTREYADRMKKHKRDLEAALARAEEFYDEKNRGFNEPFEAFVVNAPTVADFQADFSTRVEKLKATYLEAFPRKPPEDPNLQNKPQDDILPGQDKRVFTSDDEVKEATKQYWILEAVFNALHQLKLGGLESITFPPPVKGGQAVSIPPQYKVVRASVKLSLPMDRLEPLVSSLYQAEKVSMDLESLSIERDPATVIQELIIQKEYEKPDEAAKDSLPDGEPPVNAEITLRAIEWVGFPKEPDPKDKKK